MINMNNISKKIVAIGGGENGRIVKQKESEVNGKRNKKER